MQAGRPCAAQMESLWGFLIADAIAMPVHWYYNPNDIKKGYGGWLSGYVAPNDRHPSSILTLSATGGSGRSYGSSQSQPVVGRLILHDKLKYWTGQTKTNHYHQGMQAGDNTLNAITALKFYKTLTSVPGGIAPASARATVMQDYVNFMTTPGSHKDTYAESWHRLFFQDWDRLNDPPTEGSQIIDFCQKRYAAVKHEDHQIPSIGALVVAIPWVVHCSHLSEDACANQVIHFMQMTHPAPSLMPHVDCYARLLHKVINGKKLKDAVIEATQHSSFNNKGKKYLDAISKLTDEADQYPFGSESRLMVYQEAIMNLGSACYIDGAMKSLLFLAYVFHDNFEAGVLGNANCGGENAHRGAALGALLGANTVNLGKDIPKKFKDGLKVKPEVEEVIRKRLSSSSNGVTNGV